MSVSHSHTVCMPCHSILILRVILSVVVVGMRDTIQRENEGKEEKQFFSFICIVVVMRTCLSRSCRNAKFYRKLYVCNTQMKMLRHFFRALVCLDNFDASLLVSNKMCRSHRWCTLGAFENKWSLLMSRARDFSFFFFFNIMRFSSNLVFFLISFGFASTKI